MMQKVEQHLAEAKHYIDALDFSLQAEFSRERKHYKLGDGLFTIVYDIDEFEVIKGFIPKGGNIHEHTHNQDEHYVVVVGQVVLYHNETMYTLSTGDSFTTSRNIQHRIRATEDSSLIVIRIPSSQEGRLNGRKV